jgi:hypothetical protein
MQIILKHDKLQHNSSTYEIIKFFFQSNFWVIIVIKV